MAHGGRERARKPSTPFDNYRIQPQPRGHRPQFSGERVGDGDGIGSGFDIRRQREQPARGAIGFEIDAGDQALSEQKWQHVISPAPLLLRREYLYAVIEPEESSGARAMPDYRIEWRQQRRGFDPSGHARLWMKVGWFPPSLNPRLAQFPLFNQFGDAQPSVAKRHAVIIGQIAGRSDAVRTRCKSQQ